MPDEEPGPTPKYRTNRSRAPTLTPSRSLCSRMGSKRATWGSDTLRPWFRSGIRYGSFWSRWPAGSTSSSATSSTICRRRTACYASSLDLGGSGSPTISASAWPRKPKTLGRRALTEIRSIVTPDTLLAWHRALIARKYDGHLRRGPGRPRYRAEIREWVVRMATENRSWGYTRIQGALANLDHHVSRGTIANILRQHGIEPAPERQKRTTWQEFLRTHRGVLAAADFFSVEVWTAGRLTRFAVLFVIDLATRRVEIAGIVREPDSAWVVQCGRQLTDPDEGCLRGKRFLLHDRDPRFTNAFADTLAAAGVETVRLPPRSPNLNAYAERFVRTIKEWCLDRLILVGETLIASCDSRVRRTLPSRTKPSRHGQPIALPGHEDESRRRPGRMPSPVGWTVEGLPPTRGVERLRVPP